MFADPFCYLSNAITFPFKVLPSDRSGACVTLKIQMGGRKRNGDQRKLILCYFKQYYRKKKQTEIKPD